MKTAIYIIAAIALLAYIGELQIKTNPFKIYFPEWNKSLAVIFFTLGSIMLTVGQYAKGYSKGLKHGSDIVIEALKEKNHEQDSQVREDKTERIQGVSSWKEDQGFEGK